MDFFGRKKALSREEFETLPFLLWFSQEVERPQFVQEAARVMKEAAATFPSLGASWRVLQGAPEHLEGPLLESHIERMLTALFALVGGTELTRIEEFKREQHIALDLEVLKYTLEEHVATFVVFALLHDFGKQQKGRVVKVGNHALAAPFELAHKQKSAISQSLIELYGKLHKATGAELGDVAQQEVMIALHDKYGIEFSAMGHEKWFINDSSVSEFEALFETYRLTPRDIQLLKYLIRYHDTVADIEHHRAAATFELLERAADEYGLDGADARDALFCVLFLNHICGKVVLKDGKPIAQTDLLLQFINVESHHFTNHRARKREASQSRERMRLKAILEESGVRIEELLRLCQVPYTPAREHFVNAVYAYVRGESGVEMKEILGAHFESVIERLDHARALFTSTSN